MGSITKCSKCWVAAASIGAVEALKDQGGFCRWNYAIRSVHHNARNNIFKSISEARNKLNNSIYSSASSSGKIRLEGECGAAAEESLRKVMFLSCWGPNS